MNSDIPRKEIALMLTLAMLVRSAAHISPKYMVTEAYKLADELAKQETGGSDEGN